MASREEVMRRLWRCSRHRSSCDPIGSHWSRNVLERLLAHILESKVKLSRGVFLHARRDADPTGLGQRFKPSGHIDTIPEDVTVLDHYVAHVDANAVLDA